MNDDYLHLLNGLQENQTIYKENALLGNYEMSSLYFEGFNQQMKMFLPNANPNTKSQWNKISSNMQEQHRICKEIQNEMSSFFTPKTTTQSRSSMRKSRSTTNESSNNEINSYKSSQENLSRISRNTLKSSNPNVNTTRNEKIDKIIEKKNQQGGLNNLKKDTKSSSSQSTTQSKSKNEPSKDEEESNEDSNESDTSNVKKKNL